MIIDFMATQPKREERNHRGHRYILTFDPHAPVGEQWVWQATVVQRYDFHGHHATIEQAARQARRRIDAAVRLAGD